MMASPWWVYNCISPNISGWFESLVIKNPFSLSSLHLVIMHCNSINYKTRVWFKQVAISDFLIIIKNWNNTKPNSSLNLTGSRKMPHILSFPYELVIKNITFKQLFPRNVISVGNGRCFMFSISGQYCSSIRSLKIEKINVD